MMLQTYPLLSTATAGRQTAPMSLDEVADALYALPPEDFTAARDAEAKADPALRKRLATLRRPTVAAWVVNVLAREDSTTLEDLLALGPALAEAQSTGQGDRLRALSEQRRALLGAVATRAVELAGRDVTAAVRLEVESTLDAALVDSASADAVRSGRLVRALSFAGFGGVDLEGATATPVAPAPRTARRSRAAVAAPVVDARAEKARAEVERLEAAALDAAGRLDDAVRELEVARRDAERATTALAEADEEVARVEEALAQARQRRAQVHAQEREATAEVAAAERRVERRQARAEKARQALDAQRRS